MRSTPLSLACALIAVASAAAASATSASPAPPPAARRLDHRRTAFASPRALASARPAVSRSPCMAPQAPRTARLPPASLRGRAPRTTLMALPGGGGSQAGALVAGQVFSALLTFWLITHPLFVFNV